MLLFADDVSPKGLNRRHIASHIHKRESVRLKPLCSFAAGYGLEVMGCDRYAAVGW